MSPAASIGVIDAEARESTLFQQMSALIYTCSGLICLFLQSLGEERLQPCAFDEKFGVQQMRPGPAQHPGERSVLREGWQQPDPKQRSCETLW